MCHNLAMKRDAKSHLMLNNSTPRVVWRVVLPGMVTHSSLSFVSAHSFTTRVDLHRANHMSYAFKLLFKLTLTNRARHSTVQRSKNKNESDKPEFEASRSKLSVTLFLGCMVVTFWVSRSRFPKTVWILHFADYAWECFTKYEKLTEVVMYVVTENLRSRQIACRHPK